MSYKWCFLIALIVIGSKADTISIRLDRVDINDSCIQGILSVDGKFICKTLELPILNNAENISSIPNGFYSCLLRYDHSDLWRLELSNVLGRKNVQIHIGNKLQDSKGCILVGQFFGNSNCSILNSRWAYFELRKAFYGTYYPNSTPNRNVILEISERVK